MDGLPCYLAAGFIGIFVVLILCILLAAWAERHGRPPAATPDYESGEP